MRRLVLTSLPVIFLIMASAAQTKSVQKPLAAAVKTSTGYNIPITLTPLKNTWIYLGCHFGKYKNLVDSALLNDKSEGVFKGKEKLAQGIYFTVSPNKALLFAF